jgi:hypothetical protein
VAVEVDDADHVEGAAGEDAGQAAPQAVAHAFLASCRPANRCLISNGKTLSLVSGPAPSYLALGHVSVTLALYIGEEVPAVARVASGSLLFMYR